MADAKPITPEGVFVCECCGKRYAPTSNKDGSVRKTKWRACSHYCVSRLSQGTAAGELETECVQCGAEITKPRQGKRYCGKSCSGAARRARGGPPSKRRATPTEIKNGKRMCVRCKAEKPLGEFVKDKKIKSGYKSYCMPCSKLFGRERAAKRSKASRENERKRKAEREGRTYRPIDQIRAKTKSNTQTLWGLNAKQAFYYWIKEKATDEQVSRWWCATGKPWLNKRLSEAERYRMQYALDLEFQVNERMRRQVRKAKNRDGIGSVMREALVRGGVSRKVERELGYSIAELMRHIEKQFTKRMTWERFRAGEIHIDHIIPQASFDLADDDEWRKCWCLSNLRPMWARENIAKGAKVITLC